MNTLPDDGAGVSSLSRQLSPEEVTMELTSCGLLTERATELARLYREHVNWTRVEDVWFEERRANRSTTESARKLYRILTSRFKNAPAALPNPRDLPAVLDRCSSSRDTAQILYLYLLADDALVRYVVHEYVGRLSAECPEPLDFSNETLAAILDRFEHADGTPLEYADSTTRRWCEGFRSVMREIGVLEGSQTVVGSPPTLGETPLLVALGYSSEAGDDEWFESPIGLQYLFQPDTRWGELYDRAAETGAWELVELHGRVRVRPLEEPYPWTTGGGGA